MSLEFVRNLKAFAKEPKAKKTYVIAKVSKKRAKLLEDQKDMQKLDKEFYREHWLAAPHRCENCGCSLGKEPHTFFFHHLLEKRNYPELRHVHENIMLLCLEDHSKAETNIDFAPKIKERRLEAEKQLLK
jgi:hypothetical protein